MTTPSPRPVARPFPGSSWPKVGRIAEILRAETVSGGLLVGAAIVMAIWGNSPWRAAYAPVSDVRVGLAAVHLEPEGVPEVDRSAGPHDGGR